MQKYVAFLRGINISGKNKISMTSLKSEFEKLGFLNVKTFFNSGNIVYETDISNSKLIIEKMIIEKYGLEILTFVIDMESLKDIFNHSPSWWNTAEKEKYDNIIFILSSDLPEDVVKLIGEPTKEFEQIELYKNIIFWTFDRSKYQKCNWWKKTAMAGIGEKLTIRTANTIKKICE